MKRILMLFFISTLFFNTTYAENKSLVKTESAMSKSEKKAEMKKLRNRLYEIKLIAETTQLTDLEKSTLREEVQGIKQRLDKMDGVTLYLSLTAILIILLLILLI